jgi:DNA-binding NtrC family response regulator
VPPLRERREDIPALVESFIARFNAKHGKRIEGISREAMDALARFSFPGNVRELENLVERAVVLARGSALRREDFPHLEVGGGGETGGNGGAGTHRDFEKKMQDFETGLVVGALEGAEGNQSRAAEMLGISERHLRSRMEKLGIQNRWR